MSEPIKIQVCSVVSDDEGVIERIFKIETPHIYSRDSGCCDSRNSYRYVIGSSVELTCSQIKHFISEGYADQRAGNEKYEEVEDGEFKGWLMRSF